MSELSKNILQAEKLLSIVTLATLPSTTTTQFNEWRQQLTHLIQAVDKQRLKSSGRDPVTGAALYGAQFSAKVSQLESLVSQVQHILNEMSVLFDQIGSENVTVPHVPEVAIVNFKIDELMLVQNAQREAIIQIQSVPPAPEDPKARQRKASSKLRFCISAALAHHNKYYSNSSLSSRCTCRSEVVNTELAILRKAISAVNIYIVFLT